MINSPQELHLDDDEFENCDGPYAGDGKGWDVKNSTGEGNFNLYTGTQNSVNTFFAQLETRTGMCEPLQLAKDMGVKVPLAQKVPSWILGVSDSNPLEMAQAYATFAARGLHCDPRPVTAVLDSQGQTLKEFPTECEQVMPGATADAVNDILRGVMEPGGFGQNIAIDKPSAGKTGTTTSGMSVWFVGYTPEIAAAAMIAGANEFGEWLPLGGQTVGGSYISEAFGSGYAGPIWGDAMAAVSAKLDYEDFQAPAGDEIAGVLTGVPDVAGQSVEAATSHARGGRLHRRRRRPGQLRDRAGPGGLHLARQRHVAEQRRHRHALHLDRLRPAAAQGRQRRRQGGKKGNKGRGRGNALTGHCRAPDRQPSCLRTSAATAPPSARPLTCGVTTPITLPIARMPSSAAPVWAMAAVTSSAISASVSGVGRYSAMTSPSAASLAAISARPPSLKAVAASRRRLASLDSTPRMSSSESSRASLPATSALVMEVSTIRSVEERSSSRALMAVVRSARRRSFRALMGPIVAALPHGSPPDSSAHADARCRRRRRADVVRRRGRPASTPCGG